MQASKTSLAIHTNIHLEKLDKAKTLMKQKYNSTFDAPSHITHLLYPMFEHKFLEVQPKLIGYLSKLKPFEVQIGDIEIGEKRKFFAINVDDSKLKPLHKNLLSMVTPYRDGAMRDKDIERLNNNYYDTKHVKYLKKYGYPRVLDLNKPHITLGGCETKDCDLNAIKKSLEVILDGVVNTKLMISEFQIVLHTNTKIQSDIEYLYREIIKLG